MLHQQNWAYDGTLNQLRGKCLGCHCKLESRHGDVLHDYLWAPLETPAKFQQGTLFD